jgi:hypothetical protein
VANVYITPANHFEKVANEGRRLDLCAGVYQTLATPAHRLRLLCGDLNVPQHERESGEIITWGYNKRHGGYILKDSRDTPHGLKSSGFSPQGEERTRLGAVSYASLRIKP